MLESVKISRRQSEIRQALAGLVGKSDATEDEVRSMETMDAEYRQNEIRYRASLIAEDAERRDAKGELETRGDREYAELIGKFELRQAVLALHEGRVLDGPTAEIVSELRSQGGYRGVPVPWMALERRVGETIASGVPDPMTTHPIIDRLFPDAAAARMGAQLITIDSGSHEWPVVTSSVVAAWQATELGDVGAPVAFETTDKPLAPNQTLGVQMKISRKSLKQSGYALEAAIRRDMSSAVAVEMDRVVFLGSGIGGEPLGVIPGAVTYGITATPVGAAASWGAFRSGVTRFMLGSAAGSPGDVRLLIRPEIWDDMDGTLITDTAVSEWDRMVKNIPAGNIVMSANALAAPAGVPLATDALLTTSKGGVAPIFVGLWGAVDLIRDPFSDAASGGLRLTALATLDCTVARPAQLEILTGIQ